MDSLVTPLKATHNRSARVCFGLLVFGSALLTGCTTYSPKPLDYDSLSGALIVPGDDVLRVMASELPDPVLATVAIDLSDGVGPDEAAVLAVVLNPSLRAQRAARGVESAEMLNAGLLPDPTLSVGAELPSGGTTAGAVTGVAVGLDWAISDLIDRPARKEAAQRAGEAVDLEILWSESLVASQARGLVYGLAGARKSLALLDEEITLLKENVASVRAALDAGQMTEVDMVAARASLDAAVTQRTFLQEAVNRAGIELATLIGFPPDANLKVDVSLDDELNKSPGSLTELLATMEQSRFDLLALRRGYDSQEASVRAAILRQFPRLSLGPTFARDTGSLSTVGIGIGLELPLFNANRGEIAIERATREQLAQEYAARVHNARASLAYALNRLESAQSRIRSLENTERSQASLVSTYRIGLEQGHVDVLSYYQARRDLIETRIVRAQVAAEIHASRLLIEVLAGESWHSEEQGTPEPVESTGAAER